MKNQISIYIVAICFSFAAHAAIEISSIGFIGGVSGDVKLDGVPVKSGQPIRIGSRLETGTDGKLQILIGDGMVAAVGFDSKVKIEKYEKKAVQKIATETAQVELQKGSLRYLVSQTGGVVRMATVRSGDAFGIVKDGESHFQCNEARAKKYDAGSAKTVKR